MNAFLMNIDAGLLILAALSTAILLCADNVFRPILPAVTLALLGGAAFLQAMWLLGVWIPGAVGYPWPRLTFDAALFLLLLWRTVRVLRAEREDNRRCAKLRELRRRQFRARLNG